MSNTYKMARGETRTFTFAVRDLAGELVDLTDARIRFTVRNLAGELVLTKGSTADGGDDSEIEIPNQAADSAALKGQCYLKIGHADTTDLEPTARWADCWVVTNAGPAEYLQVDARAPFYVTGAETIVV